MLPGQIVVIFQTSCDFINNLKGFMFFFKKQPSESLSPSSHEWSWLSKSIRLVIVFSMPFGLKNAAQTFNASWTGFSEDYRNSLSIWTMFCWPQRRDLHLKHLNVVLDLQVQNGLVLNLGKCNFAQREIDYLGHKITPAGIVPLSHHIDALLMQPHP